jgi:hypothetical protein
LTLTTAQRVEKKNGARPPGGMLIRQASAWRPGAAPEQLPLQDLESAEAIRWVDLRGDGLSPAEIAALLEPVCHGELTPRMARDLVTPSRYPAGRAYGAGEVAITAGFSIRRTGDDSPAAVFDPVHILVGPDWLITCWLPPRPIRTEAQQAREPGPDAGGLYESVAENWQRTEGEDASELADLVRRELAIACGYRPRI